MGARRISVLVPMETCVECGTNMGLHIHEIFYGPNRQKSIEDGYVIPLCGREHNLSDSGIHFNKALDLKWKQIAQEHWEANRGTRQEFRERYGKSYL